MKSDERRLARFQVADDLVPCLVGFAAYLEICCTSSLERHDGQWKGAKCIIWTRNSGYKYGGTCEHMMKPQET